MQAVITTPRGDIRLVLFPKTAPKTVENFVKLAKDKFYDGLAFHRVVAGFVIQGGCPNTREGAAGAPGTGGPGWRIKCEVGAANPERHTPGTLSMAHAGKDTGGSQFFVTHAATPHLDGKHTVFGRVVDDSDLKVVLAVRQGDRFSVKIIDDAPA
jgi:peptidyl-prolyl cis-trans isomerase B (cyclophilin B)